MFVLPRLVLSLSMTKEWHEQDETPMIILNSAMISIINAITETNEAS
jgi:hypothetical protein